MKISSASRLTFKSRWGNYSNLSWIMEKDTFLLAVIHFLQMVTKIMYMTQMVLNGVKMRKNQTSMGITKIFTLFIRQDKNLT
jgi:hypothetical protein